jgi:hypothetical protein
MHFSRKEKGCKNSIEEVELRKLEGSCEIRKYVWILEDNR